MAGKEEAFSLKRVTGEEECSLKLCPTKRKAPTAGDLHPLMGSVIKRKGERDCSEEDTDAVFSEEVDKCADATVLADVTMDEIEEQAISDNKVSAVVEKGALGKGFSEAGKSADAKMVADTTTGEEEEPVTETKVAAPVAMVEAGETESLEFTNFSYYSEDDEKGAEEEEEDYDGDEVVTDADIKLVWAKVKERYAKFVEEELFANIEDYGFHDYALEDFMESEDEEERRVANVETAL